MSKSAIIFDFDGVLADSFDCLFALNADAFRLIGRTVTTDEYRSFFEDNIHSTLRRELGPGDWEKVRGFKAENFARYYGRASLFPFARGLVEALAPRYGLGIVSSTQKPFIEGLLGGLASHFSAVFGSQATSKADEIKEAMAWLGVEPARTRFVTDTVGDVRVGNELGVETIAVCWGFHDRIRLDKAEPAHRVEVYSDLAKCLQSEV